MARRSLPRPRRIRWSGARVATGVWVVLVLAALGLEAYRYQLSRQVADAQVRVDKVRSEADALEARARALEPVKPLVERALAGILDPQAGNLSHQELAPLLAATRASGVGLSVVSMGNRSRSGTVSTQAISLQVRGEEHQILRFLRELEQARPLIRIVAWQMALKEAPATLLNGTAAGPPSADGLSAQFTILYYHH